MNERDRVSWITTGLRDLDLGWGFLMAEVDDQIQALTAQLVNADNEQTRGRLKALHDLKDLPQTLEQERQALTAALALQDAAASGLSAPADPWEL